MKQVVYMYEHIVIICNNTLIHVNDINVNTLIESLNI